MASSQVGTNRRRSAGTRNTAAKNSRTTIYVDGSTARRLQTVPQERRQTRRPRRQVSAAVKRNRAKAASMNVGFLLFLTAVSVAILFFSVHYLQLKAEITTRMEVLASVESELSQLKEDNDAYYSQITSTADLSEIKKKAMGDLGMNYPTEEQIITYETSRGSYVRQYQDVPGTK